MGDSSFRDDPHEAIVAPNGYPNKFVELPIRTHLPSAGGAGLSVLSRNHIAVLSSDVLVALPGGTGTASEVSLAVHYGVPVCRFLGASGNILGLSDEVEFRAPAFHDLAGVQSFVWDAIMTGPRRTPAISSGAERSHSFLQRRASSAGGLDSLA